MKKILLFLFIYLFIHEAKPVLAQVVSTDSVPKVSIYIDVDGTQISIVTPDIQNISEKELDYIIKNVTRSAQKSSYKVQLLLKRIDYLKSNNVLDQVEADQIIDEILQIFKQNLQFDKIFKENWEDQLDDQFERLNDELEKFDNRIKFIEEKAGIAYQSPSGPGLKIDSLERLKSKKSPVTVNEFPNYKSGQSAFILHFSSGVNQLSDNALMDADLYRSWTFAVGFHGNRKFTPSNILGIYYGLSYRWTAFGLPNDVRMDATPMGIEFQTDPQSTATSSRLRSQSLEAPLLLTFSHSKGFTNGFYFGVGLFGGYRFANSTMVSDLTGNNDMKRETKTYANFHVNPLYAGARVLIGARGFTATASYELNSYFRSRAQLPSLNLISLTFGIDLTN